MATTSQGWTIVSMPSFPSPRDVQFSIITQAGLAISDFTGQQQVHDWNARSQKVTITMPSMNAVNGAIWENWLTSMNGVVNVCQLNPAWSGSLLPSTSQTGYWRFPKNTQSFSVGLGFIYGFAFELIEAK